MPAGDVIHACAYAWPLYGPFLLIALALTAVTTSRRWLRRTALTVAALLLVALADLILVPQPWGNASDSLTRDDFTGRLTFWVGVFGLLPFLVTYLKATIRRRRQCSRQLPEPR
ncbi:hypothetical protein [Streptomyces sp. H27-C3]|uniref:hypothetical protein n=1 Tax=Streptomyces sp. H27-C3 TaxID=3046305 RepID=UPI0024BB52A0|nr:hypothetical protein [Streptomyces sp. H27-C3]MDJ0464267.1 hypothetical protein [Streptomyces sp. H27-C3]